MRVQIPACLQLPSQLVEEPTSSYECVPSEALSYRPGYWTQGKKKRARPDKIQVSSHSLLPRHHRPKLLSQLPPPENPTLWTNAEHTSRRGHVSSSRPWATISFEWYEAPRRGDHMSWLPRMNPSTVALLDSGSEQLVLPFGRDTVANFTFSLSLSLFSSGMSLFRATVRNFEISSDELRSGICTQ